jgi:hypothetical protein
MSYPIVVVSVALSLVSFQSAAQPLLDDSVSLAAWTRLAQRISDCRGVMRGVVKLPVCCVKGSAAGCVTSESECKSRGGTPNSSGHKDCNLPATAGGAPASR